VKTFVKKFMVFKNRFHKKLMMLKNNVDGILEKNHEFKINVYVVIKLLSCHKKILTDYKKCS
jgi:hypothetical protein